MTKQSPKTIENLRISLEILTNNGWDKHIKECEELFLRALTENQSAARNYINRRIKITPINGELNLSLESCNPISLEIQYPNCVQISLRGDKTYSLSSRLPDYITEDITKIMKVGLKYKPK